MTDRELPLALVVPRPVPLKIKVVTADTNRLLEGCEIGLSRVSLDFLPGAFDLYPCDSGILEKMYAPGKLKVLARTEDYVVWWQKIDVTESDFEFEVKAERYYSIFLDVQNETERVAMPSAKLDQITVLSSDGSHIDHYVDGRGYLVIAVTSKGVYEAEIPLGNGRFHPVTLDVDGDETPRKILLPTPKMRE